MDRRENHSHLSIKTIRMNRKHTLQLMKAVGLCWILVISGMSFSAEAQCVVGTDFDPGEVYEWTGNDDIDNKLSAELDMLTAAFQVSPHVWIIDDGNAPNAFASAATTVEGETGTIYLGINLLADELGDDDRGELGIVAVFAHEFAHILQFIADCPLPARGKQRELHADFMAGYYVGLRQYVAEGGAENAAMSIYEKGDYGFFDRNHHGTPEERVLSFIAGVVIGVGQYDLSQAYNDGLEFVMEN